MRIEVLFGLSAFLLGVGLFGALVRKSILFHVVALYVASQGVMLAAVVGARLFRQANPEHLHGLVFATVWTSVVGIGCIVALVLAYRRLRSTGTDAISEANELRF